MTSPPIIERFETAAEFSAAAGAFLAGSEAQNNLLLGITSDLLSGGSFGADRPYFAVARRDGPVTAAAVRTPPWGVVLSSTADLEATDSIAEDLHRIYPSIPGLLAPVEVADRFCDRWESLTPQRRKLRANERIHRCSTVRRARSPLGGMRPFTESDRQLTVQWTKLFLVEARLPGRETNQLLASIDRRLGARDGGYFFWDVDGEAVSMAASGGRTPSGVRIGPVYTPPNFRGKGYATALVADLSSLMLSRGMDFCFLFTDMANPTSNSIYAQIGYEPVVDCKMYDLEPA
jgi:predicted GNAT family acetyltransferase